MKPSSKKPVNAIKTNTNIKKRDMNWFQAKTKFPKLNPFGDADRDRVINMLDCKPFNKSADMPRLKKDDYVIKENITRKKYKVPQEEKEKILKRIKEIEKETKEYTTEERKQVLEQEKKRIKPKLELESPIEFPESYSISPPRITEEETNFGIKQQAVSTVLVSPEQKQTKQHYKKVAYFEGAIPFKSIKEPTDKFAWEGIRAGLAPVAKVVSEQQIKIGKQETQIQLMGKQIEKLKEKPKPIVKTLTRVAYAPQEMKKARQLGKMETSLDVYGRIIKQQQRQIGQLTKTQQLRRERKERITLPLTTAKKLSRIERDLMEGVRKETGYVEEPEPIRVSVSKGRLPQSFIERVNEKMFGKKEPKYKVYKMKAKPFAERIVSEPITITDQAVVHMKAMPEIEKSMESSAVRAEYSIEVERIPKIVPKKERGSKAEIMQGVQAYYPTKEKTERENIVRKAQLEGIKERMLEKEIKDKEIKEERVRVREEKEEKEREVRREKEDLKIRVEEKKAEKKGRREERKERREEKKEEREAEKEYELSAQKLIDEA
jgi:hypothetical protein